MRVTQTHKQVYSIPVPTETATGFIVQAFAQPLTDGTRLCFVGRLSTDETFAVVRNHYHPSFFVRRAELARAQDALGNSDFGLLESWWKTLDGAEVAELRFRTMREASAAAERLALRSIRTYEADLKATDRYLMDQGIHGSCEILGSYSDGRYVDRVYIDAELSPSDTRPTLRVLAIDIETEPTSSEIRAVSLVLWPLRVGEEQREAEPSVREVLFQGPSSDNFAEFVQVCTDERDLLEKLTRRIRELDPDIVTGWNVIEFDFRQIAARLAHHRLPFAISRSRDESSFLDSRGRAAAGVSIPGRQVIDAMRLVRHGPQRYEDRRLDTVANAVLGTGKTETARDDDKLARLEALYQNDPAEFCRYCLVDSELVVRILARTGLMELTVMRSLLIGVALNRAWTSISAFEFLYIEGLHKRGLVAPTPGVDPLPLDEAPGGAILTPHPGIFRNVFVFDFKSLYPSIIRTFNIDPVSLIRSSVTHADERGHDSVGETAGSTHDSAGTPDNGEEARNPGPIEAPGGTLFNREPGILPSLLDRFFENRQAAKDRGDATASYVYKIIMNSFYGVLGARGCRFAASALAGSITGFGQHLLRWCRDKLSEAGYRVIYGDTDSLFVLTDTDDGADREAVQASGERIAAWMNTEITRYVEGRWHLSSRLELEFEKVYTRFFLPAIRHSLPTEELRGRAKGYAGLVLADGDLEIRGMEAVRSDWTVAAGEFQRGLLARVFSDAGEQELAAYIRDLVAALKSGRLDGKLVYSKNLRKGVAEYTHSLPPHVQAAKLLPAAERHGAVRYLLTVDGPQPEGYLTSQIDYDHYIDKQLRPIAESIADFVQLPIGILDSSPQLNLFE
jgi:DNA polymerase-2